MNKSKPWNIKNATRILFLSSIGLSLLLFIVALVSTRQFFHLEIKEAQSAQKRVLALLDYELDQIEAVAADYSHWDDSWNYMQGTYPEYPKVNFTEESLQNLGFDFVGIYTIEGKSYFSYFADQSKPLELPDTIPEQLQKDSHGLVSYNNKPYLIAIQTILHTDLSGPPAGYLIFGRILDQDMETTISKLSGTTVHFYIAGNTEATPRTSFGLSDITTTSTLPALLSDTSIVSSVSIPRDLFWNGFRSLTLLFILTIILIGVVIANYMSSRHLVAFEKNTTAILEQEVRERTENLRRANAILLNYKKIIENTGEGIIITDLHGCIQEINQAITEMTGFSKDELLGNTPRIFKSGMHTPEFYRSLWESVNRNGKWEGEIWNRKKDGTLLPLWLSINTLKDAEGKSTQYVAFYIDITQLKQTQEKLNNLAFYDSLTGLPNRALFMDRLEQVLSRAWRDKTRFALLYMDLDHFKDVNDGYGHQTGDELLILAAHRIKAQVREADTVCRLGGDEFTVILEEIHKSSDAALVAKKIIEALQEPFIIQDREIYIGSSVGIALYPFDGATMQELVKNADAAMYDAKGKGRGQFRFASGAAGISSRRRIEVEAAIRKALDENRFILCYQPLISTGSAEAGKSKGIIGAEALIRIQNPDGSLIPPGQFIEIAEESGLIIPMGGWALTQACKDARTWAEAGKPIQVSVNVSQRQFERGHIIKQTEEALRISGLDPKLLKLEVTESLFIRDAQRVASIMEDLKKLGICFAIDDFGTGYSSMRYIDALPIESLKIDKSFVDHLHSYMEDGSVALAVVSLARSFGLMSVAEGVETKEQLEALKRRGCDVIQGYYISKPLCEESFRDFILHDDQIPSFLTDDNQQNEDEEIEELESI